MKIKSIKNMKEVNNDVTHVMSINHAVTIKWLWYTLNRTTAFVLC